MSTAWYLKSRRKVVHEHHGVDKQRFFVYGPHSNRLVLAIWPDGQAFYYKKDADGDVRAFPINVDDALKQVQRPR